MLVLLEESGVSFRQIRVSETLRGDPVKLFKTLESIARMLSIQTQYKDNEYMHVGKATAS